MRFFAIAALATVAVAQYEVAPPVETSVVYSTQEITVTSCSSDVEGCPGSSTAYPPAASTPVVPVYPTGGYSNSSVPVVPVPATSVYGSPSVPVVPVPATSTPEVCAPVTVTVTVSVPAGPSPPASTPEVPAPPAPYPSAPGTGVVPAPVPTGTGAVPYPSTSPISPFPGAASSVKTSLVAAGLAAMVAVFFA